MSNNPLYSGWFNVVVTSGDNVESMLYGLLMNDDNVTSLIDNRLYPNLIPQNTSYPAVSYQQISGPRGYVFTGPDTTVQARYQFNCWASTYLEAKTLADCVRLVLSGYSGTVDGLTIESIMLDNEGDFPDLSPKENVLRRFGKRLDFMVYYKDKF